MIFIDGFGLGSINENNPYYFARTPFLDSLIGGHFLYRETGKILRENAVVIPTDSLLNVEGIPQSATGQTTLWTGQNAAQIAGEHINAYPTEELQNIISAHSIMKVLNEKGKRVTFANAYRKEYLTIAKEQGLKFSTSTLVALSSKQALRTLDDLTVNNAVYQDFTNSLLVKWGYDMKIISPETAGENLAGIAQNHDFTLYEYFISDRIGHKQDISAAVQMYEEMDTFVGTCVNCLDLNENLVIIVSDHGNIEDLTLKTHTLNPVPTIIIHNNINATNHDMIGSLTDITPFVLQIFGLEDEKE
ncbi:MAG TPA: alkaline phosphatase family protein [Syntrophomonadaceae bacterium]|nr:alkaline phosphatase family protein [Syntrophomonadaceae bacterium]